MRRVGSEPQCPQSGWKCRPGLWRASTGWRNLSSCPPFCDGIQSHGRKFDVQLNYLVTSHYHLVLWFEVREEHTEINREEETRVNRKTLEIIIDKKTGSLSLRDSNVTKSVLNIARSFPPFWAREFFSYSYDRNAMVPTCISDEIV